MRILLQYIKPYKKLAILAPIFMLLEACTELLQPKLMILLISNGVGKQDVGYITKMGLLMALVAVVGIIGGIVCLVCASSVSQRSGTDLRLATFKKIQDFSFFNIDTFKTPSLITRLTNDITQIQLLILMSLRMFIRAPLLCFGSIIMALNISLSLTMIFIGAIFVLSIIIVIVLKFALPKFKLVQEKLDNVNTIMRECLAGIRVVKAFVRHDYEEKKFDFTNEDYRKTSIHAFKNIVLIMPVLMIVMNISIVLILWFGGIQTYQGSLQTEEIMALISYLMQMLMSMMMIAMIFVNASRAKISIDRISEVLESEIDILESKNPVSPNMSKGEISFEHVSFRYKNGSGDPVLDDISFHVKPGECVGILGETGSGKTTLVSLLPRLYDVSSGSVKIDAVDVRDYSLAELRKSVGIVLQETTLFTGTIRNNISWGKPDAAEEEIIAAAKAAQAHDFIVNLPNGYDTELSQKGVNVSGGQKQRISIARALIQNPSVIIFDDSTSAVDSITEKNIQLAMKRSHPDTTKLIIAQKISSIKEADKILVLSGGKIVGEGNHNYLMETNRDYQEIFASQMKRGVMLSEQ